MAHSTLFINHIRILEFHDIMKTNSLNHVLTINRIVESDWKEFNDQEKKQV